ncbi:MAG: helix-turn-helix domain-containing protein [Gammaproteobacteria bacterium]|nr:helix-turn-helix domain-containing protein [Gammaproteobacteria bacterium]
MAQVSALVEALKSVLKAGNLTYAEVARTLELSESSIKRKFSRQDFSLLELDRICAMVGMEISELVKLMEEKRGRLQHLTSEQETEIADDLGLLMVTVCVLNRWTFAEILGFYTFSEPELIQLTARLDRLKLIELLPNNRIKLLVAPNFNWLPRGPIETVFLRAIQQDFFTARFEQEDHQFIVLNGMLSMASNAEFRRKMERLAREFDVLNQEDNGLPFDQRHGYTVLLALRDWRYRLFTPYLNKESAARKRKLQE